MSKTLGFNGVEKWGEKREKKFSKISSKKFGGKEKVRIFAVPKRKDGFTGRKFERKKFIENIEKTSSKIQIIEFLQSVNSFGNKDKIELQEQAI